MLDQAFSVYFIHAGVYLLNDHVIPNLGDKKFLCTGVK